LTWAAKEAVAAGGDEQGEFIEFNELLSIGYFENSYMGVSFPSNSAVDFAHKSSITTTGKIPLDRLLHLCLSVAAQRCTGDRNPRTRF
jgi:hypothetical protein